MEDCITVRNLTLSYRGGIKKSVIQDEAGKKRRQYAKTLKGISFSIKKGDIVGVVGLNGSGKSTLLKVLAGVFKPDHGKVNLHGNSVTLMSLGVGFNNELSGVDNIFLSGLLMGFTQKQIKQKLNKIIEFSELGPAVNNPIKTYSSGMRSKLAFAISAELETDILLLDEVFAVGDIKFQQKSLARINEMIKNDNITAIIVSHNTARLKRICNTAMWIDQGNLVMMGDAGEVIDAYEKITAEPELKAPELTLEVKADGVHMNWTAVEGFEAYRICKKEVKKGAKWTILTDVYQKLDYVDIPEKGTYLYTVRGLGSKQGKNEQKKFSEKIKVTWPSVKKAEKKTSLMAEEDTDQTLEEVIKEFSEQTTDHDGETVEKRLIAEANDKTEQINENIQYDNIQNSEQTVVINKNSQNENVPVQKTKKRAVLKKKKKTESKMV